MEAVRAEMGLFCVSTSQTAKVHLQIFSFPAGAMTLQVMLLSPFQVSFLVRISLGGQMGRVFLTVSVTWVKISENVSTA